MQGARRGTPFDRGMWVARSRERLERDWIEKHAAEFPPRVLMPHVKRIEDLSFAEYFHAVDAVRKGGAHYSTWKHDYSRSRASTSQSSRNLHKSPGTPISGIVPRAPSVAPILAPPPAFAPAVAPSTFTPTAAASPTPSAHVDHNLEMFREGHAAGGRYEFDGDVVAVGDEDDSPVTDQELEKAHDAIRDLMNNKFSTFRKAFRELDEDRSGSIKPIELYRALMMFNLYHVRGKTLMKLAKIADKDGDGHVNFREFCDLMSSDDVLPLAAKNRVLLTP